MFKNSQIHHNNFILPKIFRALCPRYWNFPYLVISTACHIINASEAIPHDYETRGIAEAGYPGEKVFCKVSNMVFFMLKWGGTMQHLLLQCFFEFQYYPEDSAGLLDGVVPLIKGGI